MSEHFIVELVDGAEKVEKQKIWKVTVCFDEDDDYEDAYFTDKSDAKKYFHDRVKELLDDENSYDEDGNVDAGRWVFSLRSYLVN